LLLLLTASKTYNAISHVLSLRAANNIYLPSARDTLGHIASFSVSAV
jgi:hypothetical protein